MLPRVPMAVWESLPIHVRCAGYCVFAENNVLDAQHVVCCCHVEILLRDVALLEQRVAVWFHQYTCAVEPSFTLYVNQFCPTCIGYCCQHHTPSTPVPLLDSNLHKIFILAPVHWVFHQASAIDIEIHYWTKLSLNVAADILYLI